MPVTAAEGAQCTRGGRGVKDISYECFKSSVSDETYRNSVTFREMAGAGSRLEREHPDGVAGLGTEERGGVAINDGVFRL